MNQHIQPEGQYHEHKTRTPRRVAARLKAVVKNLGIKKHKKPKKEK